MTQPRPTVQPPQAVSSEPREPQSAARTAVKPPRSTEHDDMSNTGVFFSSLSNHRESVKVQQEHLAELRRQEELLRQQEEELHRQEEAQHQQEPPQQPAGDDLTSSFFWNSSLPTFLCSKAPPRSATLSRPHRRPNSLTPS